MTKIIISCDHCGKEVDDMVDYNDIEIEIGHLFFRTDLCKKCFEELSSTAWKYCNKEECKNEKI